MSTHIIVPDTLIPVSSDTASDSDTVSALSDADAGATDQEEIDYDEAVRSYLPYQLEGPFPYPKPTSDNIQVVRALKLAIPTILYHVRKNGYNDHPLLPDVADYIQQTIYAIVPEDTPCSRPSWTYQSLLGGIYRLFAVNRATRLYDMGTHPRDIVISNPATWVALREMDLAFRTIRRRFVSNITLLREEILPLRKFSRDPYLFNIAEKPWGPNDTRWQEIDGEDGNLVWTYANKFIRSIRNKVEGLYKSRDVDYRYVFKNYILLQNKMNDRIAKFSWIKYTRNQITATFPPELILLIFTYLEPAIPRLMM